MARRRRPIQISTRAMLITMSVCAVWMGVLVRLGPEYVQYVLWGFLTLLGAISVCGIFYWATR